MLVGKGAIRQILDLCNTAQRGGSNDVHKRIEGTAKRLERAPKIRPISVIFGGLEFHADQVLARAKISCSPFTPRNG